MNTYFDNNELDIDDFNKKFEEIQKNQETTGKEDEDKKLNNFKNNSKKKKFKDMTLIELITNTKKEIFALTDDLIKRKFKIETFTKNDRLFYLGLFLLAVSILIYILSYLFSSNKKQTDINVNMPNEFKFKSNVKSENDKSNKNDKDFKIFSSQIKNLEKKLSQGNNRSNVLEKKLKELSKTKANSLDKEIKKLKKQINSLTNTSTNNDTKNIDILSKIDGKLNNLDNISKSVQKVRNDVKNIKASNIPLDNGINLDKNVNDINLKKPVNITLNNDTLPLTNFNNSNLTSRSYTGGNKLSVAPKIDINKNTNYENRPLRPQW